MLNSLYLAKGLSGLYDTLVSNWIGPAYLIGVAAFAIIFLKDREFRKLFAFLAIAAIVGILIFFTKDLFDKGGSFTKTVGETAKKVGN